MKPSAIAALQSSWQLSQNKTYAVPASQQTQAFSSALQGAIRPERAFMKAAQNASHHLSNQLKPLQDLDSIANDPNHMLKTHCKLATTMVGIDLTAKLVGSVAQSINRLVSIQ